MLRASQRALLQQVLSLPTAPFHEEAVSLFVRNFAKEHRLPVQQDRYGNLKITYQRGASRPTIVFTAHMDHPGFEVVRGGTKQVLVRLLGGVNEKQFVGARVIIVLGTGYRILGAVRKRIGKYFLVAVNDAVHTGAFGYFNLPGCQFRNGKIHSKSIDNVASVSMLLELLRTLQAKKSRAHVVCLFTRAEEVGFVGAVGAIRGGFIPKKIPVIVLENSSAKAGKVRLGDGPVLRVGDKRSCFDPTLDLWVQGIARRLQKKEKRFSFQRALMTGGTCEASPFRLHGFATLCLANPLENYHNQGKRGPAPEAIAEKDYGNLLKWLMAIAKEGALQPRTFLNQARHDIESRFRKYSHRLKAIT